MPSRLRRVTSQNGVKRANNPKVVTKKIFAIVRTRKFYEQQISKEHYLSLVQQGCAGCGALLRGHFSKQ